MISWFYKNWAKLCIFLSIIVLSNNNNKSISTFFVKSKSIKFTGQPYLKL